MEHGSQVQDELKSLEEIFACGNRIFKIPDYQRGYSWEEQQRTDLLRDIEYVIKSGNKYRHYTGTIVASYNDEETKKKDEQYKVFDIVDGQQRLTSLILLMSLICRSERNSEYINKSDQKSNFSMFIQGGTEGNTVRKLYLGKDQDKLFRSLIEEGTAAATGTLTNSKSDQNLKDAIVQFEKWLNKKDINGVSTCVRKELGFLFYAPSPSLPSSVNISR